MHLSKSKPKNNGGNDGPFNKQCKDLLTTEKAKEIGVFILKILYNIVDLKRWLGEP